MPTHYVRDVSMSDRARMQESAKRRRMLEGVWEQDLIDQMAQFISAEQLAAWGRPDLTANPFRSVVSQLAVIYDRAPIISHPDQASAQAMRGLTEQAGVWTLGPYFQRLVIGLRECFRRLDWHQGQLQVRVVSPDLVTAESSPDDPATPHTVIEYRPRVLEGADILTREVLSVRDGDPVYRIETADGQQDLTAHYLGQSYSGDAYPYRDSAGQPVLPYVLTHAANTGKLFDAFEGRELVNGALTVAVLFSYWRHIVFDCGYPQRYAINARPAGLAADPSKDENATYIPTDPASLLIMEAANPDQPVTLGQFQPGGDPVSVMQAIQAYSANIASEFDIGPHDIQRTHADARSGYALLIANSGKRAAQAKYAVHFAEADRQLMRLAAILHNRYSDQPAVAEDGYQIAYQPLPLSVDERRARTEEYRIRAELGTGSVVQFLAELEGITEEQARQRLEIIRQDRIRYGTGQ